MGDSQEAFMKLFDAQKPNNDNNSVERKREFQDSGPLSLDETTDQPASYETEEEEKAKEKLRTDNTELIERIKCLPEPQYSELLKFE